MGRRGYRKAWAWSARGGLSAFGSKAQPVVRMGGDRRSRIPKARGWKRSLRAWLLRDPSPAQEPTPTIKGVQGEEQLRSCLGQRVLQSKAILVTAPSGSGLSGFLFGENQQKTNKAKRERGKGRPGGAFSLTWALVPLLDSDLHIPARAVPTAGVQGCVGESGGRLAVYAH